MNISLHFICFNRPSRLFWFLPLLFILAACSFDDEQGHNYNSTTKEKSFANPGFLRLPLEGISTIDPGLAQFNDAIEVVEQLFLGLTDFDPKSYAVIPELATHWHVSDDGLTYKFFLRKDVAWTDGKVVFAKDVVWAIKRNLKAQTAAPNVSMLFPLKNAEALHKGDEKDWSTLGVRALDEFTLEFKLNSPIAYFPALAGLPIYRPLPHHVIEEYPETWLDMGRLQTNGSYRVEEWKKGQQLELRKNPYYFDEDKVRIDKVVYYIVPESSLGFAMYRNNELDVLGEVYLRIPPAEKSGINNDPKLRREHISQPNFCTEIYGINTRIPPTDNHLVRKALVMAVNKQLLINFVIKGEHLPATTFTRPPIFGSVDPDKKVGLAFNPDKARALLIEAGYAQTEDFPTLTLVHNKSETHKSIAIGLKTMWEHYLNIDVKVLALDFDNYVDTLYEPKDTHLFRIGWCADYPDANNWLFDAFHPEKSPNFVGWKSDTFSQQVELAQRTTDIAARVNLYEQAEKILNEEQTVLLPVYFASADYLVKPWVKDWYSMAFGGQQIRHWSLDVLASQ